MINIIMSNNNKPLIDALYREILGRPADDGGVIAYDRLLSRPDRDEGIADFVRSLRASAEYGKRIGRIQNGKRLVDGRKVRHIVSMGTHCLTSYLLKKHGLKRYSLPFDWLFSSPDAILHCLDDGFSTLLDQAHYRPITERRASREPGADHAFYRDRHGIGDMFAHRDPSTSEDYRYLKSAVARFDRLMKLDDAKLFVMIARPAYNAIRAFPLLSDKIRAMTGGSAFVCIQLREPTEQPGCHSMTLLRSSGDHSLFEFQPSSNELGVGFDEPIDDAAIMRLVSQFDLDLADAHSFE